MIASVVSTLASGRIGLACAVALLSIPGVAQAAEGAEQRGIVIAPGGGGILSNENRIALKQNSRVYWLNRTLAKLDRANRPLSTDLEALYEARRALYEAVSDYAVENEDKNSHLVADKIIDEFYQPRGPVCL